MSELNLGNTPILDVYAGSAPSSPLETIYQGTQMIYGRQLVVTADPMVYEQDGQMLSDNRFLRQRDNGVPDITSDANGITFGIVEGTSGSGAERWNYSGFGCELMKDGSGLFRFINTNAYTAVIEMGDFVNVSEMRVGIMTNTTGYPPVYATLLPNTVNTVTFPSSETFTYSNRVFIYPSDRPDYEADWSFQIKSADVQLGDWT